MTEARDQQLLVLPNGLKVVLVERPFGKSFTACLSFLAGSQEDPRGGLGLAHLTEHLAFTGPTRELSRELAEQAVYVNGSTSGQRTAFYASGHREFLKDSLRFLASVLEERRIDSDTCRHEREIVYQEMVDGEPDSLCGRNSAYWKMKYRLSGDPNWECDYQRRMESVRKLESEEVNAFRDAYYCPSNAALAIVAPLTLTELERLACDLLGPIVGRDSSRPPVTEPCDWRKTPDISYHFDRWSNVWIGMTNTAPDSQVVTRHAANVLSHQLGGGQHSEMYGRFREESAVAYNATSDYECWLDSTAVTSFVSVNKKSAIDALKFLVERTQRYAKEGIDGEQLDGLIQRTGRWWEMRMEKPYHLANFLSFEALRPEDTSMLNLRPDSDAFRAIGLEQLNAAVRRIFAPGHCRLFVGGRIGPLSRRRIRKEMSRLSVDDP